MDVFLNELGARLRAKRQQLELSQTQVARSADRSKQLVSAWERGTAEITVSCLAKVSRTLSVDPGWLLFGENWQRTRQIASNEGHVKIDVVTEASEDKRHVRSRACDQCRKLFELHQENSRLKDALCNLLLGKLSAAYTGKRVGL